MISPVCTSISTAAAPLAFISDHAAGQHLLGGGLHGQIERQRQRRAFVGRIAQIGVELAFDPGHADHLGRMATPSRP